MQFKFIIFFVILFLFHCSTSKTDVLQQYLDFIKSNNYTAAYQLLSRADKATLSLEEFMNDDGSFLSKYITRTTGYKILKSVDSITSNAILYDVEIKQIDLLKLYENVPLLTKPDLSDRETEKIIQDNINDVNRSFKTIIKQYKLISEEGIWHINADYALKKEAQNIEKLADNNFQNYHYKQSLSYYKKLFGLENSNIKALERIRILEERLDFIEKNLKYRYWIKNKTFTVEIQNSGTIVVKKIVIKNSFSKNNRIILDYDKVLLGENETNRELFYMQKINIIKDDFEIPDNFDTIQSEIIGIEF